MIFLGAVATTTTGAFLVTTGLTGLLADQTADMANAAAWFGVLATGITLLIIAVWKGMSQGMRMWLDARAGTERELRMKVERDNKECEDSRKELTEALHAVKDEFVAYKVIETQRKAVEMQRIIDLEMRLDKMHDRQSDMSIMVLENGGWIAHEKAVRRESST